MYMYGGLLEKYTTFVLVWQGHKILWDKYYYWMKLTRMNVFLISLFHPCIYGRGNIRVSEGTVEMRTKPLLA
jgi:hypothetical protein